MPNQFTFNSQCRVDVQNALRPFNQAQIKVEPMLFSCALNWAYDHGGAITRDFLARLPNEITRKRDFIVDSRVHMLMPGWYPCIPGYHHDDVQRATHGQPDYRNSKRKRTKHVMGLAGDEICKTEFAIGSASFEDVDVEGGEKYYKKWHPEVLSKLESGELMKFEAPHGYPIYFDDETWHTGTKATGTGWRFFIRCSWDTTRKPVNEIRRQVQVYLENPMDGW